MKERKRKQNLYPEYETRSQRKRKRRRRLLLIFAFLVLAAVAVCSVIRFRDRHGLFKKKNNGKTVPVTLEAVYDGDTLRVRMPDGTKETVRLLMIDAPESVHPDETKNTEEGRKASEFLSELLGKERTLYLEYEDEENNRDLYGRLLAYVWLTDTTSVESSFIKENMVNAIMLVNGHAEFHVYRNGNPVNETYKKVLEGIR